MYLTQARNMFTIFLQFYYKLGKFQADCKTGHYTFMNTKKNTLGFNKGLKHTRHRNLCLFSLSTKKALLILPRIKTVTINSTVDISLVLMVFLWFSYGLVSGLEPFKNHSGLKSAHPFCFLIH